MKILSDKKVNDAIYRIAANQLIAEDALKRAHISGDLSLECYADASSHLVDNTVELASIIGGAEGISKLNNMVERYRSQMPRKGGEQ